MNEETENAVETLSNLFYLLRRSAEDPTAIRAYLDVADQCLLKLKATAHSGRPDTPKTTEV